MAAAALARVYGLTTTTSDPQQPLNSASEGACCVVRGVVKLHARSHVSHHGRVCSATTRVASPGLAPKAREIRLKSSKGLNANGLGLGDSVYPQVALPRCGLFAFAEKDSTSLLAKVACDDYGSVVLATHVKLSARNDLLRVGRLLTAAHSAIGLGLSAAAVGLRYADVRTCDRKKPKG
ncbi:F-box/RNI-like/FBD-like domains-containing protein [Striga asiatica]|uniref:F-box/RNI-like/FBD-like domains-containing protein n=1 Tax=Striga asiatica TaxID=4170 RepID=A0A5A7PMF2_STRAF|nr:F-box/RNI-like/FBD-like domains-containing protein [Striga asiatica]